MLADIVKASFITQVRKLRQERASPTIIILHVGGQKPYLLPCSSVCESGRDRVKGTQRGQSLGAKATSPFLSFSFLPLLPPQTLSSPAELNQPSASVSAPEGGHSPAPVPAEIK